MSSGLDALTRVVAEMDCWDFGNNYTTLGVTVGFAFGVAQSIDWIEAAGKVGDAEQILTIFASPFIVGGSAAVGYGIGKACDEGTLKTLRLAYAMFKALKTSRSLVLPLQ